MRFVSGPVVGSEVLAPGVGESVIGYLAAATVVVVAPGFGVDEMSPGREQVVPLGFQCDGVWVWPASVGYYARKYGVFPVREFIEHMSAVGFIPPPVSDEVCEGVAAELFGPPIPIPAFDLDSDPEAGATPAARGDRVVDEGRFVAPLVAGAEDAVGGWYEQRRRGEAYEGEREVSDVQVTESSGA